MRYNPLPALLIIIIILASCKQKKEEVNTGPEMPDLPAIEDVVMYEVFVRNFTQEGTFTAVIPHLDRLKKLGVNVLWFMPIQPTGIENHKGTYGSPYSISHFTDVHPGYGTKADFKELVDSIHAKGMFIIIDEVANHTAWDCPWIKEHPDWYTHDSTGKIIPSVADWTDIADLNFDNAELWKEKIRGMKYWVDSFNIDGYRCDVAELVPVDFWKECIPELRKSRPLIMLAEGATPELYDAGFDMTYGWEMYHALKKVWNGKAATSLIDSTLQAEEKKYPSKYRPIRFIDNHDENSWDNVPQNKFVNAEGAKAAFITSMTLPGTPFVYNGQETGYPTRINLFEKYTIDWRANPELQDWYTSMIRLYSGSDALKKGKLSDFDKENEKVLIYQRSTGGQDGLWVIVNTRNEENTVVLPAPLQKKKLRDMVSGDEITTEETMMLAPFEYHIVKVN